jgi:hypothetical protein
MKYPGRQWRPVSIEAREVQDMDFTTLIVIAIAVFVVAAFILLRVFKKASMEELRMHYGEKMLFDDDNCTLEVKSGSGTEELPDIFVRVTNKRIIISQRGRGRSGHHMLRYVILYEDSPSLKKLNPSNVKDEFVVCITELRNISISESGMFKIALPPGQGPAVPEQIQVKTANISQYQDLFR